MSNHPSETVFTIPELLETILLHLDPRTLLTAQSTCKTWTTLITTSPRIQQALFFIPSSHPEKELNPLLVHSFPSLFPSPSPREENYVQDARFTFTSLDMFGSPAKMKAYMRAEASWRRMLVQQPPVFEIGLVKIRSGMRSQSHAQFRIQVSCLFVF